LLIPATSQSCIRRVFPLKSVITFVQKSQPTVGWVLFSNLS